MRGLLRRLYYGLPRGWLPWSWRIAIADWLLDLTEPTECLSLEVHMGGKPQTHTPYDRRLTTNKDRPPHPPPAKPASVPPKKGSK